MEKVKSGDRVKVHYHGRLQNGETFDTSAGRDPLEFEVGSGQVIRGFEEGVTGMSVGDKKTIDIEVQDAYGPKSNDMIVEYPKNKLPDELKIEIGMPLMMSNSSGQQFQVKVTDIKDEVVLLDANHPLAGEKLIFDIELVEIM